MLNRVSLQGRLVRDPELRRTNGDVAVANFSLAVERDFKDRETGERQTDFFDIVVWRGTAEFVERYFHKGDMAVVTGRLQNNRYTDKDGNNRVRVETVADNVYFGGSKRESGETGGYAPRETAAAPVQTAGKQEAVFEKLEGGEDDLPF